MLCDMIIIARRRMTSSRSFHLPAKVQVEPLSMSKHESNMRPKYPVGWVNVSVAII